MSGTSSLLAEKIQGCEAVPLVRLESQDAGRASNDWVVTGVMIQKSCLKLPLTGMLYYLWKLSYLKEKLETSSLFIFGAQTSETWKLYEWTVSSR